MLFACIAGASASLIGTADARPRYWGGYYEDYPYQGAAPYPADTRYRSGPRRHADHPKGRHNKNPEKGAEPEEAAVKPVQPAQPKQPSGPMFFVVSIGGQHVSVYSSDGLLAREPISTGMPGHPTPMGIFNILGKERLHHSNIYSGAPMPFMQRITWSGVAMHEGVLPGYPASHGCIRLSHDFAQRMFGLTQGNERVIITRRDVAPVPFSHPNLPVPALLPIPRAQTTIVSASILQNAVATSQDAGETINASEDADGAQQKLLNPSDYAKAMKALAAKKAAEAATAVSPARIALQAKAKEMQIAVVSLKKAQIALNDASGKLQAVDRQLQKASGNGPINAAKAAAEAKVVDAQAQVETAERAKAEKDAEWASTLKAYKDLDNVQKAAADTVKIWSRRAAPVSVFISRKTQRLYIRQNFIKVVDVPVVIRDPAKPIGTHLYMAMPPAKGTPADSAKLRWVVLTLPEGSVDDAAPRRRHGPYYDDDQTPRAAAPATSASAALDRVEIPPEVGAKISEMLWAGGSIIVSDSGMSRETDDYSDFIILTR